MADEELLPIQHGVQGEREVHPPHGDVQDDQVSDGLHALPTGRAEMHLSHWIFIKCSRREGIAI